MRHEPQYCRYVASFIKSSPHDEHEPYYSTSHGIRLLMPTQDTRDIIAAATRCLDVIWKQGPRYQKAGVMLGDFFRRGVAQLNLFDDFGPRPHGEQLMALLDTQNEKGNRLWFASQGISPTCTMKRSMLSPVWTTRLSDVPCTID